MAQRGTSVSDFQKTPELMLPSSNVFTWKLLARPRITMQSQQARGKHYSISQSGPTCGSLFVEGGQSDLLTLTPEPQYVESNLYPCFQKRGSPIFAALIMPAAAQTLGTPSILNPKPFLTEAHKRCFSNSRT